jgi:hypothetical protein
VCDQASNTLKLYGGFEEATGQYISYKTGYVNFTIIGVDNPSITDLQYLTVSTIAVDAGLYQIDSSYTPFGLKFNTGKITVESITPTNPYIYSADGTY